MEPNSENLRKQNLLSRWGLTVEELTRIVDANPSMRGLMLGYVAGYKLRKIHFGDPRFSEIRKDDDHDRKQKGDIRLTYRGKTFRIECKSLQTNSIKVLETGFKATFQCDASDRRPVPFEDGSTVETTCLLVGGFDIVAVNLFSFEEKWNFAFALNQDLPRSKHKKYTEFQKSRLLASSVPITWPLRPPFEKDPVVLLDRLLDEA